MTIRRQCVNGPPLLATRRSPWRSAGRLLVMTAALRLTAGCELFGTDPGADGGEPETDPFVTGAFKDDWTGTDRTCAAAACVELKEQPLPIRPTNLPASLMVPASVTGNLIIGSSSRCTFIDTELGRIVDGTGGDCLTRPGEVVAFQRVRQSNGTELGVFLTRNFALQRELRAQGDLPLVIVAQGQMRLEALLFAGAYPGQSGVGATQYPRSGQPMDLLYKAGRGPGGGGAPQSVAGHTGGGGGGFCGRGGGGSGGVAGGVVYGSAELSPLLGGSTSGVTEPAAGAGGGGGAVQLVAGESITITGTGAIAATGHGGGQFGIGGGSGGAILLEAPVVKVNGKLSANGAAGASGLNAGADGTMTTEPARGLREQGVGRKATTGGDGSGGAITDGTAGLSDGDASSGPGA